MRSWWLCSCSPEFEQTLYPEHIEVMYPACDDVTLNPVTDGSLFLVTGDDSFHLSNHYLLNGVTGDKIPFFRPPDVYKYTFLTSELLLVYIENDPRQGERDMELRILNWQNGSSAPVQRLDEESLGAPFNADGSVNPEILSVFENTTQLFIFDQFNQAVGLTSTELEASGDNFFISKAGFPTAPDGWLKAVVEAGSISYVQIFGVPRDLVSEQRFVSPDGRYVVENIGIFGNTGIFDAATEQLVVPSYSLHQNCYAEGCFPDYVFCCWLPDSSGAIYVFDSTVRSSLNLTRRRDVGAPGQNEWGAYWMPVLKVRVPEG